MTVSALYAFSAEVFSPQTAGVGEADGWCDGWDSSVPFATMKEETDTNSFSQFTSSAGAHCLIKATDSLIWFL